MGPRRKVQPGRGSRAAAVFECLRASQGRRGTQQLSDLLKPSHLLAGGGRCKAWVEQVHLDQSAGFAQLRREVHVEHQREEPGQDSRARVQGP